MRAHCWKLEPVEMRHQTLAQMVHWNSHFPKDVLRENRSPRVPKPELCVWLAPGPQAQYRRALATLGGLELQE